MSKNNSAKQFINENGKVRFRLYKSGKKWLIAGTATVSGLLGGMFIMPHGVQAASQPQIGKVIDKGEVLATKGSATIPASSTQASTATSESASTTDLNSASQSTSTSTSTATSTSTSNLTRPVNRVRLVSQHQPAVRIVVQRVPISPSRFRWLIKQKLIIKRLLLARLWLL